MVAVAEGHHLAIGTQHERVCVPVPARDLNHTFAKAVNKAGDCYTKQTTQRYIFIESKTTFHSCNKHNTQQYYIIFFLSVPRLQLVLTVAVSQATVCGPAPGI